MADERDKGEDFFSREDLGDKEEWRGYTPPPPPPFPDPDEGVGDRDGEQGGWAVEGTAGYVPPPLPPAVEEDDD
jgi:hypothetical protein